MKNIVLNKVNSTVDAHLGERFSCKLIFNEVWKDPKISGRLQKKPQPFLNWPDAEAYAVYINALIGRRIRRNLRKKINGDWRNIREFWSVEKSGRECIYARVTLLSPQELRQAGTKYIDRAGRLRAKGIVLVTLADDLEKQGLPFALDEQMVWDVVNKLVSAKKI